MTNHYRRLGPTLAALLMAAGLEMASGQTTGQTGAQRGDLEAYVLGAKDEIVIHCPEIPDVAEKPAQIEGDGSISFPLLGRVSVAGLTLDRVERLFKERLQRYVYEPRLSVSVTQYGSQPVFLMGAINQPGEYQLRGERKLIEVLSMGGGLRADAGSTLSLTRQLERGELELPDAHLDATGKISSGTVDVREILAGHPEWNISVRPYDVISVPKAQMVYVVGEVRKPGGFVLPDGRPITVLEALALAEGISPSGAGKRAKMLRRSGNEQESREIPVDLDRILDGRAENVRITAEDILFVPTNKAKNAAMRAVEAIIQTGTGIAIYRR